MSINHIFIFTNSLDESANELINFGFKEGSSRIHPGQGTKNRKFYFENFYLELLYVHNEEEIRNKTTAPSKLFERSQYKKNGYSPFGLCLDYDKKDDQIFKECINYKPIYLPPNMAIEVITNSRYTTLPWTFRWQSDIKGGYEDEPINSYKLTNANFYVKINDLINDFTKTVSTYKELNFYESQDIFLELEFNDNKENKNKAFDSIPLVIKY